MINLAVINKKDLIKYLLKLAVIVFFIITALNVFSNKNKLKDISINVFNEKSATAFLDETIPGIKELNTKNNEEKSEDNAKFEPLGIALKMELGMLDTLIKKEQEENNTAIGDEAASSVEESSKVTQAQTGLTTQVVENNVPDKFTDSYNGVQIKNGTDYKLTEEMLKPDVSVNNKDVLIFHTHTCESYTPSENYNYEQTGTYRTTDYNYSVVRVGTELENQLKSYNYNVIHDKTYHDYPAYSGSYDRSLVTVDNILKANPDIDVVLDIHRDAIGDYSYAPKVKIGDEYAAQLMFVIGTDGGGLNHQNWNENLKFAVKIQEKANEMYPGLFKSIVLRNSRYNQHLAKGASIIEVGATGNTLDECLNSMKYLAKVLSEVMK